MTAEGGRALAELKEILSETVEDVERRQESTLATALRFSDTPVIVLWGAGRLGKLCARCIQAGGIPIAAICDNNPQRQGSVIEGVRVEPMETAIENWKHRALFIVAIWTGNAISSIRTKILFLKQRGCAAVIAFPPVLWAWGGSFLPFYSISLPSVTIADAKEIWALGSRLSDQLSINTLLQEVKWRLWAEPTYLEPASCQYFPPDLFVPHALERVIDVGACIGDTLNFFRSVVGDEFSSYLAVEPDPENFLVLARKVDDFPQRLRNRISLLKRAFSDSRSVERFAGSLGVNSSIDPSGMLQVETLRIDDLEMDSLPTIIKIDVEGSELRVLHGASRTLLTAQPRLAVCTYHAPDHLVAIYQFISKTLPSHRVGLRMHGHDGWEMVMYVYPQ